MVLSGFEFRFEKVPCDKFRLSYGICFYNSIKNRWLNNFSEFFTTWYFLIKENNKSC